MTRNAVVSVYDAAVVPDRYRSTAEPDPVGEDRLLTREGLIDASDETADAWGLYRAEWQYDVRKRADLEYLAVADYVPIDWTDGLTEPELWALRRLIVPMGKRMGWVHGPGKTKPLNAVQRKVWFAWRSGCLKRGAQWWHGFWHVAGHGEPLPQIAREIGVSSDVLTTKMQQFVRQFVAVREKVLQEQVVSSLVVPNI